MVKKEKIGRLDTRVQFYTPLRTRTTAGGEAISWVLWVETWAQVEAIERRGNPEPYESDRLVAVNIKAITTRVLSIPGVNETMYFAIDDDQFEIQAINPVYESGRKTYLKVQGIRKTENIVPVQFLATNLFAMWSENLPNINATYAIVTAGTLHDTDNYTESDLNSLLFVYRSGLRLTYGAEGADGFTIDNATNKIIFNSKVRGENILVHQYGTT